MTPYRQRTDYRAMDGHDPKCATFRALPGYDLRLGQAVLDVVARRGDLRPPVVPSAAVASHDRLPASGPV